MITSAPEAIARTQASVCRARLVRPEQSQIDHLAAAAGDQLLHDHGLELLSAVEELGQAVDGFARGERDRGVVRVVGLDRAAARRVRVEQDVLAVMGGGSLSSRGRDVLIASMDTI